MKAIHRIHHIVACALCFALVATTSPAVAAPAPSLALQQPTAESALQLHQSDQAGVTVELATPAFQIVDDVDATGPCQRVEVGDLPQAAGAGDALLPVRVALIGVPAQAELLSLIHILEIHMLDGSLQEHGIGVMIIESARRVFMPIVTR